MIRDPVGGSFRAPPVGEPELEDDLLRLQGSVADWGHAVNGLVQLESGLVCWDFAVAGWGGSMVA